MYLWIGLGIETVEEENIRKYCKEINKKYNVNEQSFTLPQHISLKTSFCVDDYKNIIKDLKNIFLENKKLKLKVMEVEMVPGVIWLIIEENDELRKYHNSILKYLEENYNIKKIGFDGDSFKFHSTLFQDTENKEKVMELYNYIDKDVFKEKTLNVNKMYFGVSEVGKVGTYKVIDYLELK